jgi:hypothetical protein
MTDRHRSARDDEPLPRDASSIARDQAPHRSQTEQGACGHAAMRSVLAAEGIDRSERQLLDQYPVNDGRVLKGQGLTCGEMAKALRREGLDARVRHRANLGDIEGALGDGKHVVVALRSRELYPETDGVPFAANHFVTVTEVRLGSAGGHDDTVRVHDPARGADQLLTRRHFEQAWDRWGLSGLGFMPRPIIEVSGPTRDESGTGGRPPPGHRPDDHRPFPSNPTVGCARALEATGRTDATACVTVSR